MATVPETVEALVLRTVKYADSDTIVHLFTRTRGRLNAVAPRARSARSKLGARIEAFGHLELELRTGRGELLRICEAREIERYPRLRADYERQHVAAAALDLLGKLSIEGEPSESAYYLTANLLLLLDAARYVEQSDQVGSDQVGPVLLAAYQLKLLLAMGLAPQLATCVRCESSDDLTAWSAGDGGVVCTTCHRFDDRPLSNNVRRAGIWLFERSIRMVLEQVGEVPGRIAVTVSREIAGSICEAHAGVRIRNTSFGRAVGRAADKSTE